MKAVAAQWLLATVVALNPLAALDDGGPSPAGAIAPIPAWRGVAPGTDWLGPDVLWRPREWLIFHMHDAEGGGFGLDLTVRDMNTYMQGPRPLHVAVVGPQDQILLRHLMPDDGITTGNDAQRDGIYDTYADFRYREWQRHHTDSKPGKARSPYLHHPEQLPLRQLHLDVPDGGPGLYRVTIIASWDHWLSITPSRPIPTGVHPGPGPLYVVGNRLAAGAYLWVPATTQHLGLSLSEEIEPFRGKLELTNASGTVVAQRQARTFSTYIVDESPQPESVYRVSVSGPETGASLHIRGVPPVLSPDATTARLLHGGMEVDGAGRATLHHHQRVFDHWQDDLSASARLDTSVAAVVAAVDALRRLAPFYWYDTRDVSYQYRYDGRSPFTAAHRSGWYGLGLDSRAALALRPYMESGIQSGAIADSVVAAWKTSLTLWAGGHWLMHAGETANQWTYSLRQLLQVWQVTGDPALRDMIQRDVERLTTIGSLGRQQPDGDPDFIDLGRTPAGYMAEQLGWDGQYGVEQEHNLAVIWQQIPVPAVVQWWQDLSWLKSHITLPRKGIATGNPFSDTVSPADINFRTRYYTHKTGLPAEARSQVVFGDLWVPEEGVAPRRPWPALEDTSFVRSIADIFHFVKTPNYYAMLYSGPRQPAWTQFGQAVIDTQATGAVGRGGHVRLAGYGGAGYGGFGRKATKVGAISAVFVTGTGPILLGSNHNVMDAHTVWGRRHRPVSEVWSEADVDPTIICSGYAQPQATFDAASRSYKLREALRYEPLVIHRQIRFAADRIVVDLQLEATADLDLAELYLAVPFVADDRVVRHFGQDLSDSGPLPIAAASLAETRTPQLDVEALRFAQTKVVARAVDFAGVDSGAGTTIIFPQAQSLLQAAPIRYREIAANQGSLNLPLPTILAAGEHFAMRYVIYAHQQAVTSEQLCRVAEEEGL
jgi:hypothetical protein